MSALDPVIFDLEAGDEPPALSPATVVWGLLLGPVLWLAVFWALGLLR